MQVQWDGKSYTYDGTITVKDAIAIKAHTGLGVVSWLNAVDDGDPRAVQALVWLLKSRAGEACEVGSLDFDLFAFMRAFLAASNQVDVIPPAEDPTQAAPAADTVEQTPTSVDSGASTSPPLLTSST